MKHAHDCVFDLDSKRLDRYIKMFKLFMENNVDKCIWCDRMISKENMLIKEDKKK
jgi:hypothetical protein